MVAADSCWQIIKAAWCNIVCKCLQKWSGRKGKFHLGRLEGRRPFMKTDEFKCKCVHRKLVKCHYQNTMIKISSLYFLEKEASSDFHLQEGNFLVLLNKISQLWFMFCIYHFVDFVQKHYYYLNYPNKTINFFYWLVLWDSFIFNGFLSHFSCLNAFLFVSCNSGFTGCSVAFSSADGFPSAHHHAAEHTLPFPLSWRFS